MRRAAADITTKVLIIFDISYYIGESFDILKSNGRHRRDGVSKHFTQKIVSIILQYDFLCLHLHHSFNGVTIGQEGWVSG